MGKECARKKAHDAQAMLNVRARKVALKRKVGYEVDGEEEPANKRLDMVLD